MDYDVVVKVRFQGTPNDEVVRDLMTNVLRAGGKVLQDANALAYVGMAAAVLPGGV